MEHIKMNKSFQEGFLWGGSSSAIQFEGAINDGGRGPSVIDNFRLTKNVTTFADGSGHYYHWKEDVALAKECGLKSYRFSISWSRVFPSGNGKVNDEGVAFYNDLINALIDANIEPVITIYHFDYPQGLVDQYGGWIDRRSIDDFVNYSNFLFDTYGDRVKYWLTINEQDHVIRISERMGLTGKEPLYDKYRYQANHNMCVASARVFKSLKEKFPESLIGPALSYAPIYSATNNPDDMLASADVATLMMTYMTELHCKGVYPIRLWKYLEDRNCLPDIEPGDMQEMKENGPSYLGINYYSSMSVANQKSDENHKIGRVEGALLPEIEYGIYKVVPNSGIPLTSFGWGIDPVGLRYSLEYLYERYNLPLMITENGLSYPDVLNEDGTVNDDYRIEYIQEHLKQIELAINTGVEVLGYNLWSFYDLISGREGFNKRYGMVYVDRENFDLKEMKRYKKDSFYWYQNVIKENGSNIR